MSTRRGLGEEEKPYCRYTNLFSEELYRHAKIRGHVGHIWLIFWIVEFSCTAQTLVHVQAQSASAPITENKYQGSLFCLDRHDEHKQEAVLTLNCGREDLDNLDVCPLQLLS